MLILFGFLDSWPIAILSCLSNSEHWSQKRSQNAIYGGLSALLIKLVLLILPGGAKQWASECQSFECQRVWFSNAI